MRLTKIGKPGLWRSIAAAAGFLLVLSIGGTAVTTEWSGYINGYLGVSSTQIVQDESVSDDARIHYKSEFAKYQDALENARSVARQIQGEGSALLLNNDSALPLSKGAKVTVFGYASADPALGGSGSGATRAGEERRIDLEKAFDNGGKLQMNKTLYNYYKEQIAAGNKAKDGQIIRSEGGSGFGATAIPKDYVVSELDPDGFPADVKSSYNEYSDAAIFFFSRVGGEGADLIKENATDSPTRPKYLALTAEEEAILETIKNGPFKKKIVILNTMNTPELGWLEEYDIDACLHIGAPGEAGMDAVADILIGDVNPSARVSDTYATDSFSSPAMVNFGEYKYTNGDADIARNNSRYYISYNEGIYIGYRYYETRYEDAVLGQGNATSAAGAWASAGNWNYDEEVMFPFGYGLSYSEFSQTLDSVEWDTSEKTATVTVTVKNVSGPAGKDVVEVYGQAPYTAGGIEKSSVQLIGYAKTDMLDEGDEQTVTIDIDMSEMASYDYANAKTYLLENGDYYFAIGNGAHEAINNILAAKGKTPENTDGVMDAVGDEDKAVKITKSNFDEDEYSKSVTGKDITNRFDATDLNYYTEGTSDEVTYLSRSDWSGTWPKSMDNMTASDKLVADINAHYSTSNNPAAYEKGDSDTSGFISGAEFKYSLVSMMGADYDDERWEDVLNQLTVAELLDLTRQGRPGAMSVALPSTTAIDGPDGYRSGKYITDYTKLNSSDKTTTDVSCVAWPAEVVVADTWNTELCEEMGKAVGEEGLWGGGVGWYGPAANIHRTPYSGRNHEYYSEDGFLSGATAEAVIHGATSKGLVIYIKHCVLNDMELHREGVCTFSNEQAIREIYLKAFQAPCTPGENDTCANGVMGAFNLLGATWSGHHSGLWLEVLRGEWGYTGNITTDFGQDPSGYMEPQLAYEAGTTMFCTSGTAFYEYLEPLIENDAKLYGNMREAAHHILYNFANSAAMNGMAPTDKVVTVRTWYQNALLAITIVTAVVFAASALMALAQAYLPAKKDEKEDK